MFKKIIMPLFAAVLFLVPAGSARAMIVVSLDPAAQSLDLADTAVVELNISGLGSGVAPSLGVWELDIGFDAAILGFTGASFGTELDLFGFGVNFQDVTPGAGLVNIFELSFDFAADLDDLQASAFTLATLTFEAIGAGTGALTLANIILGDALGDPLDAASSGASVTVRALVSVPEPGSLALFGFGLAGLTLLRRRRST